MGGGEPLRLRSLRLLSPTVPRGTAENRPCFFSEFWGSDIFHRVHKAAFFLEALEENHFLAFSGFWRPPAFPGSWPLPPASGPPPWHHPASLLVPCSIITGPLSCCNCRLPALRTW